MRQTILFLFRTYNDIDHIVPVAWKVVNSGASVAFLFVSSDLSHDYRIEFLVQAGARKLESKLIRRYFENIRNKIPVYVLKRLIDVALAHTAGRSLLKNNSVTTIVNEWSGPVGNQMAEFFIRPGRARGIPIMAFPHGHRIEINWDMNPVVSDTIKKTGKPPSLAERNLYTWYVVQNVSAKQFGIDSAIREEKLKVIGSARYSQEWHKINLQLSCSRTRNPPSSQHFRVAFFLRHWEYHIDRGKCLELLGKIGDIPRLELIIIGHTRGRAIGGLTTKEEKTFVGKKNITYVSAGDQSTSLIADSNMVVAYGTSIAFEALLQNVVICNPTFLTSNETIFNGSGVVYDATTIEDTIGFIDNQMNKTPWAPERPVAQAFLKKHLSDGNDPATILDKYKALVLGQTIVSQKLNVSNASVQ